MHEVRSHKQLKIWQQGILLCNLIYNVTKTFPKEELFGLTSQIRRCAVSIPSNIAEGYGRCSRKDFKRFLNIAYGSLLELETQLLIANQQKYIKSEIKEIKTKIIILGKMLNKFIISLK